MAVVFLSVSFRMGPLKGHQRPDETYVAANLMNFYRTGTPAPANFIHPPLYHYLCWAALAPVLSVTSDGSMRESYAKFFFSDRSEIYRVCRAVSWSFSVATPPLLFLLSWRIYRSLPAAALAGFFLSVSFWHSMRAREALPESSLSFFILLAAGLAVIGAKERSARMVRAAALVCGLAAAIKTNAVLLLPAILAAWCPVVNVPGVKKLLRPGLASLSLIAVVSLFCAGFFISGSWEMIAVFFSSDGILETDSIIFCRSMAVKLGALSAAVFGWALFSIWLRARSIGERCPADQNSISLPHCLVTPGFYVLPAVFLAGFLLLNPYWVLRFKEYLSTLVLAAVHVQYSGHIGMFGTDWLWYFASFWRDEGPLAALLAAGLITALTVKGSSRWLAVFFISVLAYIGGWEGKGSRFLQVFAPIGYMAAAGALWSAAESNRVFRPVIAVSLAAVLAWQGLAVRDAVTRESLPDSRRSALAWINASFPEGAAVLVDRYYLPGLRSRSELEEIRRDFSSKGMPSVENAYTALRVFESRGSDLPEGEQWDAEALAGIDFIVLNSDSYRRFFDPEQEPPRGHPFLREYQRSRKLYRDILEGRVPRLKHERRFGGENINGPVIDVYRVLAAE